MLRAKSHPVLSSLPQSTQGSSPKSGASSPDPQRPWTTSHVKSLRNRLFFGFRTADLRRETSSALRLAAESGELMLLSDTLAVVGELRRQRRFPFGGLCFDEAEWLLRQGQRYRDACRDGVEAGNERQVLQAMQGLKRLTGRKAVPGHWPLFLGEGFLGEREIALAQEWLGHRREWMRMVEADERLVPSVRREWQCVILSLCKLRKDLCCLGLPSAGVRTAIQTCRAALLEWPASGMTKFLRGLSVDGEANGGTQPVRHLGGFLGLEGWDGRLEFLTNAREWHGLGDVPKKLCSCVTNLSKELRAQADSRDLEVLLEGVWKTLMSEVAEEAAAGADVLQVPSNCGLLPGDDVVIGDEYHRVKRLGSVHLCAKLSRRVEAGVQVFRLEIAPVMPAKGADDGKTQAFMDEVECLDAGDCARATNEMLADNGLDELPEGGAARKVEVLRLYTGNSLYGKVNRAMYTNNRAELRAHAGYIRELRSVFEYGQADAIVEPFCGDVVRGLELSDSVLASYATRLSLGRTLCWSAFTSTSEGSEVKSSFDGNTAFKVSCFKLGQPKPGEYFPARISHYSLFSTEDEVLFPPHCFLRFVNIKNEADKTIIELETLGFPCVWDMISEERWKDFEKWADANSEMIDCRQRQHSIICAVAKSISHPPAEGDPDPIEVCLKYGANVNELEQQSLLTGLALVAKNHVGDAATVGLESVMKSMIQHGASLHLKAEGQPSALDILGPQGIPQGLLVSFEWQYWVDDGVGGKADGWYDYEADASKKVEECFKQWVDSKCSNFTTLLSVKSGQYSYDVDFASMHQVNTRTKKRRRIRRKVCEDPNADLEVEVPLLVGMLERVVSAACCRSAEAVCSFVPEDARQVHELYAELSLADRADTSVELAERFGKAVAETGSGQLPALKAKQLNLALQEFEQTRGAATSVARGACKSPQDSELVLQASKHLMEERYLSMVDLGGHVADAATAMSMCLDVKACGGRTNADLHWCLSWSNVQGAATDLDMYLLCPQCNRVVFYGKPGCDCRRLELDHDDRGNAHGGRSLENIFIFNAEPGVYEFSVVLYSGRAVPFQVAVRSCGKLLRLFRMDGDWGAAERPGTRRGFSLEWTRDSLQVLERPEGWEKSMAPPIGYSSAVAFIAEYAEVAVSVVERGCSGKPIHTDPRDCVRTVHGSDAPSDMVVLELHDLPECLLDRAKGVFAGSYIDAQYLRLGDVGEGIDRKDEDGFLKAPCPYCKERVDRSGDLVGRVGIWRFWDHAFMTSPCSRESCVCRMKEREQRLREKKVLRLYHQTSPGIAAAIRASGKMIRGHGGIVGGGIYFAETPRETEWKWEAYKTEGGKNSGVVLECAVRVGRVLELDRDSEDPSLTFAGMVERGDYDSVYMDRGICQVPGPAFGKHSGNEFIVYSWDQVAVLREVPRDPVGQH